MDRMSPELWNRIPPEAQAVFVQMAETIRRLERKVRELESRVNKTPRNSSLPPSTEHPHAKPPRRQERVREKAGRSAGTSQARAAFDSHRAMPSGRSAQTRDLSAVWRSAGRQRSGTVAAPGLGNSRDQAAGHGISTSSVDLPVLSRRAPAPSFRRACRTAKPDRGWSP